MAAAMHRSAAARIVALATTVLALAFSAPAGAEVTNTVVLEPADGSFLVAGWTDTITLRGTAGGSPGDTVDVICERPDGTYERVAGAQMIPVGFDAEWRAPIAGFYVALNDCRYRAIPSGTSPTSSGLRDFVGSRFGAGAHQSQLDGATRWNWTASVRDVRSAVTYRHFEECTVCGMGFEPFAPRRPQVFELSAGLAARAVSERAAISVDGVQAVGPAYARRVNRAASDRPGIGLSVAWPGGSKMTIDESSPLVTCPTDAVPLDETSCPSFESAGVRLDRRVEPIGRTVQIVDELVSTDGTAHEVVVDWQHSAVAARFPGEDQFAARQAGDRPEIEAEPARSVYVIADPQAAPGLANPLGAVTLDQPWSDVAFKTAESFTHRTRHSVPAGGVARMRWQFTIGPSLDAVDAIVRAAEQEFAPPPPPPPADEEPVAPAPSSPKPGDLAPPPAFNPTPAPPAPVTRAEPHVTAAPTQDFARTGEVVVTARCGDAACTFAASGKVSVRGAASGYPLQGAERRAGARHTVRLRLGLGRTSRAAVRRELRRGKRVTASIRVAARTADGRVRTTRLSVQARRAG